MEANEEVGRGMKIYVGDNKNFVWQWQSKEQIVLEGYPEGVFVHYANCDTVEAPVLQSRMEGDKLIADIPPELMQSDEDITVYVCDTDGTMHCHFLSVLSRPKPESYVYESVEVLRYESLAERVKKLEQAAEETEQKLDALMQGAGSEWEALTVTDMVGLILSPKGGLLNGTPAEDKLVSEPISIRGGDALRVTGSAKYGNSLWAIYNSAGEMIANQVAPATAAGLTVAEQEIEAPSGAASIRVAWDKTISDTPYAVSRKAAEQTAAVLPLDGQTLVVLGGSIVQGQGVANDLCTRLAAATGANVVNLGVSGTGWMHRQEEGNAYYQRVADIPEDADIVILSGGGNDRNDPLGTADSTGTDTVAGCIHATLDAVRARVPAARVCVAAPTPWQYYPPHNRGNDIAKLVDVMAEICRRRGIPFLDLYHTSGLAPWDDTNRALLFVDGDGVHPNELGYGVFAPQVVSLALGGSHNPVDVQGVAEAVLAALPKWTGGAY